MERRNELKAKARELEHGDNPEEALALYLQLLDRSQHPTPALWTRAGELQLRLGQLESARQSLTRAAAGFAEAGQLNNAIAISRALVEAGVGGADAHLRLAELALEKGYRAFARDAAAEYARRMAGEGRFDAPVEIVAAFVRRFPDERDLWRDWSDELLGLGREAEAVATLRALAAALSAGGAEASAAAVEEEILRLRPGTTPPPAPLEDARDGTAFPDGAGLPLIGSAPDSAPGDDEPYVERLAGLETTHAEWPEEAAGDRADTEPLPLLDTTPDDGPDTLPAAGPRDLLLDEGLPTSGGEDAAEPEPLPLLEPSPDAPAPVDRVDDFVGDAMRSAAPPVTEGAAPVEGPDVRAAVAELLRLSPRDIAPAEDPATHYDLGVAFKEMGLADEAIAHLAAALERGHDPVATLEVVAEILVSRGSYDLTDALLRGVVAGAGSSSGLLGIHYWLGRSAEALGKRDDARLHYRHVLEVDGSFRDADDRLRGLDHSF